MSKRRRWSHWSTPLGCSCKVRNETQHRIELDGLNRAELLDPAGRIIADLERRGGQILTVWFFRLRRRGGVWTQGSNEIEDAADAAISAWSTTSAPDVEGSPVLDVPDALTQEVADLIGSSPEKVREKVRVR